VLRERFGPADVLVNNAGIVGTAPLAQTTIAEWQRVFAVNVTRYWICALEFGADMLKQRSGSIVHVSSIVSVNPTPGRGALFDQ
jgi:glucose 1-dehydrogenase